MSVNRIVLDAKSLIRGMAVGDRVIKSLAIVSFILLLATLSVIINTGPATGYEISIYAAYPSYFWVLLIGSTGCGISAMVYHAFHGNEKSNWWLVAFLAVILANITLLLLPFFRGYLVHGREDVMSHLGFIKDITAIGRTASDNFYPVMHILPLTISYITNLDIKTMTMLFPIIFPIFYIVSIYLLATALTTDRRKAALITAFGAILIYGNRTTHFAPETMVLPLFPFILYLYFRSRAIVAPAKATSYTILFIMLLALVPFCHAMVALWLVVVLVCLEIPKLFLYRTAKSGGSSGDIQQIRQFSLIPALLEFIGFFVWFSAFAVFTMAFRRVASWLIRGGEYTPPIYNYAELLERGQVSAYEFLDLFIRWHGSTLLYFVVAAIACVLILRALLRRSKPKLSVDYLAFPIIFVVFNMLTLMVVAGEFIIGWARVQGYAILAATVLNGLIIYDLGTNNKFIRKPIKAKVLIPCTISFLILTLVLATFTVYMAPNTKRHNQQVTLGEWTGMSWLIQVRSNECLISDTLINRWRWCDALYGYTGRADISTYAFRQERILPDHFNYTQGETLGQAYVENSYLLINRIIRIYYQSMYPKHPEYARWTEEDFKNLEKDPSVDKIFSNGELEVWNIYKGTGKYSD